MPVDYSKYPPNWKDEIRPNILQRAGYRCEICKVRQRAIGYRDELGVFIACDEFMARWAADNGRKVFTIYLAIAHLNHDVTDNRQSNLMAMCQQCHNRHDANYRKFNRIAQKSKPSHEKACNGQK